MSNRNQITGLVIALAIVAMSFNSTSSASADTPPPAPSTVTANSNTPNREVAAVSDPNSPDCIACGVPIRKATKVSGPVLVSKKFVKYLTGAWARSTGYSWSSSTTVNSTIDASVGMSAAGASGNLGVSSSMTKTYSITVNIAASSNKYSKLGLASNFNRYYVKSTVYQNGKQLAGAAWTYGYLYSPTKDQYLIVYYK